MRDLVRLGRFQAWGARCAVSPPLCVHHITVVGADRQTSIDFCALEAPVYRSQRSLSNDRSPRNPYVA